MMTLSTSDPTHVLHRYEYDTDLRAKFRRRTLLHFGVYRVHTVIRLSII